VKIDGAVPAILSLLLAAGVYNATALGAAVEPQDQPTFRGGVDLVTAAIVRTEHEDLLSGIALIIVRGKENIPERLRPLPFATTEELKGGQEVIAIGFGLGQGDWAVIRANVASLDGHAAEIGTYRGGSAYFIAASFLQRLGYEVPMDVIDTFDTGLIDDDKISEIVRAHFKLTPKGIIETLDLRRPIYKKTAAFGHFGRTEPEFGWERTDKAEALRADAGVAAAATVKV